VIARNRKTLTLMARICGESVTPVIATKRATHDARSLAQVVLRRLFESTIPEKKVIRAFHFGTGRPIWSAPA
jgi:hypothetical protein